MFKVQSNKEIGIYLRKLIVRKYGKQRRFCREYIRLAGLEANDEEIRKQANRLSQILKGEKGVQITDLPIFSELLGLSCEQILSCGKTAYPKGNRVTNYSIAMSGKQKDWDNYINREDKLILNYDEYGKSVIDYALEFENYDFLKYLMNNGYIWFVDNGDTGYKGFNYGAGTSIKRRDVGYTDTMVPLQLQNEDRLRTQMVALAIKNKDFEMLDELKAREIPSLYMLTYFPNHESRIEEYRNRDLIDAIVNSEDESVLDYFSEPYIVTNRTGAECTFVFPFLGDLIDELLRRAPAKAEFVIRKGICHNNDTYTKLNQMINQVYEDQLRFNKDFFFDERELRKAAKKTATENLWITNDEKIVSYYGMSGENGRKYIGLVTNVIHVESKTQNPLLKELVVELNGIYDDILNLKGHKE